MSDAFFQLQAESVCADKIVANLSTLEFKKVHGAMVAAPLNQNALQDDAKIVQLIERFHCDENQKISVLKFDANSCYTWHTDGIRSCAINMLLTGYDSLTLFGKRDSMFYKNLERLTYVPNRYFFLDTSKSHTVLNFSEDRYIVSIGIAQEYSREMVREFIRENNI